MHRSHIASKTGCFHLNIIWMPLMYIVAHMCETYAPKANDLKQIRQWLVPPKMFASIFNLRASTQASKYLFCPFLEKKTRFYGNVSVSLVFSVLRISLIISLISGMALTSLWCVMLICTYLHVKPNNKTRKHYFLSSHLLAAAAASDGIFHWTEPNSRLRRCDSMTISATHYLAVHISLVT